MRFHELGGEGERREEGHRREFIGAFDSRRHAVDVFGERQVDEGDSVDDIGEGFGEEGAVRGSSEDGEGSAAAEEEASQL